MTIYYVDSAAGSNTAPYDTWTKAAVALGTIAALDVAGDTVYVASTHNESAAGDLTLTWAGTSTSPVRIICADKTSGAPPATIATGAQITRTGLSSIRMNSSAGSTTYWYGIAFSCGSGGGSTLSFLVPHSENGHTVFDNCNFINLSTNVSASITIGESRKTSHVRFINCGFKLSAAGTVLQSAYGSRVEVYGGSILAGGTAPANFMFSGSEGPSQLEVVGFDFTNAASTIDLGSSPNSGSTLRFSLCKMPASWSGSVTSSAAVGTDAELDSGDTAGTNYIMHRKTRYGSIDSETTLIRTSGASDGAQGLSWKMASLAASGSFPLAALETRQFAIWNQRTASSRTLTVELLHDSVTGLKDNEIWLEVDYFSASGTPLGARSTSAPNVLAAGSTLTASSTTWTTTGMANPNKQKMSVSFTPQLKGFFIARVKLTKASYTVYVDPKITVT